MPPNAVEDGLVHLVGVLLNAKGVHQAAEVDVVTLQEDDERAGDEVLRECVVL